MITPQALAVCIFAAAQTYVVPPSVLLGILNVEGGRIGGHSLELVGQHRLLLALRGTIVVVRGELLQRLLKRGLADPPVEIHEVRMIFVDDFAGESQPVVEERLVGREPCFEMIGIGFFLVVGDPVRARKVHSRGRPIEAGSFGRHVADV